MPRNPEPAPSSEKFITLLNATHGRLLAFLRVLLGNNADAEDVLQRATMTMWQKFGDFDPAKDFFAWASSFAFYEARNFQRVSGRVRLHFDDELLARLADERAADLEHREERLVAMNWCVDELDASGRELVREFYLHDTGIAALAERLGRAPQTVYNKLNVLRRMLAECVKRRLAEEASA